MTFSYEMDIQQPPTREDWISGIREAVDASVEEYPENNEEGYGSLMEVRKFLDAKYMRLRHLTAELRGKDIELARLLEDKMRVMGDILVALGVKDPIKDIKIDYLNLVREKEQHCTKEQLLNALQVNRQKNFILMYFFN